MKSAILFDLGNTLVQYYERRDFPAILKRCIARAEEVVRREYGPVEDAGLWDRVAAENYPAKDYCVRSLEDRLQAIFAIPPADWTADLADAACRSFMQPIFDLGRVYEDVIPTLDDLRLRGLKTAIVSNTPWGSPASLWREEIARLGLAEAVDVLVFCGDCGWRKPARQIFDHTLALLGVDAGECVFIGDDPRWDIAGPEAVGIEAALIDRIGATAGAISSLADLPAFLQKQEIGLRPGE